MGGCVAFGVVTSGIWWKMHALNISDVGRGRVRQVGYGGGGCPTYEVVEGPAALIGEKAYYCRPDGQPCCRDFRHKYGPEKTETRPVWLGKRNRFPYQHSAIFSEDRRALYRKDCGPLFGYLLRAVLVSGACMGFVASPTGRAFYALVAPVGFGLIGLACDVHDRANRVL